MTTEPREDELQKSYDMGLALLTTCDNLVNRNRELETQLTQQKALIGELVEALSTVDGWFEGLKADQYEKLIKGQTLASATENWSMLRNDPLEIQPIKDVLEKARSMGLGEK
jgi:hypothetical protein